MKPETVPGTVEIDAQHVIDAITAVPGTGTCISDARRLGAITGRAIDGTDRSTTLARQLYADAKDPGASLARAASRRDDRACHALTIWGAIALRPRGSSEPDPISLFIAKAPQIVKLGNLGHYRWEKVAYQDSVTFRKRGLEIGHGHGQPDNAGVSCRILTLSPSMRGTP
jgi:hypothetical protein